MLPGMLEVVRKGSRILNLTSPSGPGKPPAEGAVTPTFGGWFSVIPIQLTKAVV